MWGLYQSAVGKQLGQSYLKYVQENLALKLSVNQLLATVQQAARGDLTGDQHLRAEHSGPIVDLSLGVEQMLGSLRELVGVIQQFGLSMTESATYLTGNVTQQYRGLSQQALRSDQLTRTFGDMATAAQTLRAAVRKVNVDSLNTAIDARELQHDLAAVGSGLLEISSLTDTMSYSMKDMNGRIGGVREILATISQIANQTNMLSLNACIEAERAGDSGRGFRVIAQEMRRLSNQTSVAVDQVERTIREVTESSEQTLHKVTRFFSLTQAQIEQSRGVGERVDGVLGHIQEMKEQFALVDHSADSQSQTAHAASLSLREFNALQQLTAKGLEETAEFLKELRKTSTELKLLTERFRVAT